MNSVLAWPDSLIARRAAGVATTWPISNCSMMAAPELVTATGSYSLVGTALTSPGAKPRTQLRGWAVHRHHAVAGVLSDTRPATGRILPSWPAPSAMGY